ncbi:MAG: hypothetical protein ACU0A6_13835 [Shimia sp.]|uniref:hypothetical protein n=1 Tax=Shimia sp. TaxID=1954381 RepID=UPI0040594AEF
MEQQQFTVAGFTQARLGSRPAPDDFAALLSAYESRLGFVTSTKNPLLACNARLLWPDASGTLIDQSGVSETAPNADFLAALESMSTWLSFVLVTEQGDLLCYWHPYPDTPFKDCPLYWLNSEGQFELAEGETLMETLLFKEQLAGRGDSSNLSRAIAAFGVEAPSCTNDQILANRRKREKRIALDPQTVLTNRQAAQETHEPEIPPLFSGGYGLLGAIAASVLALIFMFSE